MTTQTRSTLIPSLRYRDALAAIDWLIRAFGFEKNAVYMGPGNTVAHAQLTYGGGMIMLGSVDNASEYSKLMVQPDEIGLRETKGIYLVVPDADQSTPPPKKKAPPSSLTSATWTTADAPSPAATSRVISGTSAPMTPGSRTNR